jgi:hypothetical protein
MKSFTWSANLPSLQKTTAAPHPWPSNGNRLEKQEFGDSLGLSLVMARLRMGSKVRDTRVR